MKRFLFAMLVILLLFSTTLAETITLDLSTSTDEELENARIQIVTEQKSRLKTKVTLDTSEISVYKGKKVKISAAVVDLKEGMKASQFKWTTSNKAVATVASGSVTAVNAGDAVITCSTTLSDGTELSEQCLVTVIVPVSGLTTKSSTVTLGVGKKVNTSITVNPSNATNRVLNYQSSDTSIATVDKSGRITAKAPGKCIIKAASTDGSKKSVTVTVNIPALYASSESISVTSKNGSLFLIDYYGTSFDDLKIINQKNSYAICSFSLNTNTHKLSVSVTPLKAGTFTLTVSDKRNTSVSVKIKITISHSAVYDSSSYPAIAYKDASRYPNSYKNDTVSFSGKVLQVMQGNGYTAYRISSKGNYDNVVYVTLKNSYVNTPLIEDDKVTVYGKYNGNYTYTTIMGASITIPLVDAEKIKLR